MTKFHTAYNYNTYYFANIISNVLDNTFPYARQMEELFGDHATQFYLDPFPRWSLLHQYIEFVISSLFMEPDDQLSIEQAFKEHNIDYESYDEWLLNNLGSDYDEWLYQLPITAEYNELICHITREVFYVLFNNRRLLQKLNEEIAYRISDCAITEEYLQIYRKANGHVARQRIPKWVAKVIFYRDRGRCCYCNADLTGLLSPQFASHVDHIIPLARGGINDVTNLQLLCVPCNTKKGANLKNASNMYEAWYDDKN